MFYLTDIDTFSSRRCVRVNGPVIVGAGPSGLALAAVLREQGVPYVILESSDSIASLWQKRTYDRLKLHLPKKFCQLPNFPFPDHYPEYPSKKQFVEYLESYTSHHDIHPQFNESVVTAKYDDKCRLWRVKTAAAVGGSEVEYISQWLVVATGENAEPVVPDVDGLSDFSGEISTATMVARSASIYARSILILKDLGYLPQSNDDYGDSDRRRIIQSAIERFQLNHGLEDTGFLDFQTTTAITERRCSWPDIVDGLNLTRLHSPSSERPSCFTLFPNAPKWDRLELTYSFEGNVPAPAKPPLSRAFAEWDRRTRFTFSERFAGGDIIIGFYRGAHGVGDCPPFNGPGGVVAHASKPCDGWMHVDINQKWWFRPDAAADGFVDLETVGLHELGHILGLSHSSDENSVMHGCVKYGQVKRRLTSDDIRGLNFLYFN